MGNESSIRTLQVVSALGMGGAETWLMELLRHWSRSGEATIDFLATSGDAGLFDDEARSLGANVHYIRYSRANLWRFRDGFRRVLRREKYDAIHDHQDYASGWHFLLGGSDLPPVRVTHVHNVAYQIRSNYGVTYARRLTARVGRRLVARYATYITGTSRQVITEYGFDDSCFSNIPKAALHCGFDPKRFLGDPVAQKESVCREFGWSRDVKIIIFAGRMDRSPDVGHPQNNKNSGLAVSIGIECARLDPGACLLFVGEPSPALPVLQARIAAAGLADRIRFVGVRSDVERLMLGSDVLLFPSRGEGLGMVAVEAQAAGLPVVASTAVPRECVVVPDLVRFMPIEEGAERWAEILLHEMERPRNIAAPNRAVAASPFSISRSARRLAQVYSGARLS